MMQTPSSPIGAGSAAGRKTSVRIILVCHGFPQNDVEVCFFPLSRMALYRA